MAPGAPRGKRKPTRGGGKNFSKNLRPLDADGDGEGGQEGMWGEPRDTNPEEESSEEESSEEEEETDKPELSREERKAAAKARKEAALARKAATAPAPGDLPSEDEDEDEEEVPRKPIRGAGGIDITNLNAASSAEALNRKERDAVEAAAAKERYWKLQEEGKTDQARADLARLAIIRQEREEKAKQRKAELEERKAASEAKMKGSGRKK